jgi:hypothetical protein
MNVRRIKTRQYNTGLQLTPYTFPTPAGHSGPGEGATGKAKERLQSVSTWIQQSAGPFVDSIDVPACMPVLSEIAN